MIKNTDNFRVTIDRGEMERRYVLWTIDEEGEWVADREPLTFQNFRRWYGFSETWPHNTVE